MKRPLVYMSLLLMVTVLTACGDPQPESAVKPDSASPPLSGLTERWYTRMQAERGHALFQTHCAACHQPDASGTKDWRSLDANGKLPPPPLDGTAHTWHHPLSVLRRTVRLGGVPLGGSMPGFAEKLSENEIDEILAWVQSRWPDEIYRVWQTRNAQAERQLQRLRKDS